MPKLSKYTSHTCTLMDPTKAYFFIKVHQSEDPHVTMEKREYRLRSYENDETRSRSIHEHTRVLITTIIISLHDMQIPKYVGYLFFKVRSVATLKPQWH